MANWTEGGKVVSRSASYTFTNIINRSLVANFIPEPPRLLYSTPQPGTLVLFWSTNAAGFVLQQNGDLNATNWVNVANVPAVVGTNWQVTLSLLIGNRFLRLRQP